MTKYSMNYFVGIAAALLFCLNIHFVYAENKEIDSLKNSIPGAPAIEKIKINYLIGSRFFNSFPDSAIQYYNEALMLSQEINNDTFAAKCLNKIGDLNFNSGEYEKAIGNLYRALKIFERYQDKRRAMRCFQYLGMAYNEQRMFDKALDYAKQSLDMSRTIGDKYSMAVSMTNIGSVYYSQFDFDKALEYFQQSLQTMEEIKDPQGIADALNNVAMIYEKKKNFGEALEVHLRSLALAKEMNDSRGIAVSYHNIGLVYKGMEKFPVAIQYLDSCIALVKEGDDKFYLKESYNTLSEVYSDMGNFEKAYHAQLLFSKLNDTLMSEENKRQFAEMSAKYETEKKDNQIGLLNKDRERQKIVRNGFIGGLVLMIVIVFFIYRNYRKQRMLNKQLSDTQQQLVRSEKMAAFGVMASRVAHEIQNPLNFVNNFSELSEELVNDLVLNENEDDRKESATTLLANLKKINHHGKRADAIVKLLQEHTRAGTAHEFFEEE